MKKQPTNEDQVYLKDNIVHIEFNHNRSTEIERIDQAKNVKDYLFALLDKKPDTEYDVILDFTTLGGKSMYPSGARKIGREMMKHPRLKRWAIASPSKVKKVAALMICMAIGKSPSDLRWFQNYDEALRWLKETN